MYPIAERWRNYFIIFLTSSSLNAQQRFSAEHRKRCSCRSEFVHKNAALGRYYSRFIVILLATTVLTMVVECLIEAKNGRFPQTASTIINFYILHHSARVTSRAFVTREQRVPTNRERSLLIWVSLLLWTATSLIPSLIVICAVVIFQTGTPSLEAYAAAISEICDETGVSDALQKPGVGMRLVVAIALINSIAAYILYSAYTPRTRK